MVATPRSYTSGRSKPTLEIILDTRFIVFNGGEHEAQNIKLTGRVRFNAPEAMSILKPKVRLEGKRKISWWFMGGISAGEVVDKRVFWNQEHKMGIESTHKVKAGPIEWPFEFDLSPSMPESVEGLRETYIVYHLHASVSRPGWNAKDVVAQEHIRIVRTLGQDSMEMTRSRVNADIWANKISYSISIPTDAIVFGTSITADVELSPIKKGLRLGKIELRLMETVVKRIQASEVPDIRGDKTKSEESEVAKTDMEFPENSRVMYDDETADNPTMADEMYKFKATLPLPKSLNVCRQDVDSHQINVTHRFKLMVNIHNPEGHISQLVCRLPVKIFISPNLPVDERNEVTGTFTPQQDAEINSNETTLVAPPEYGRHQLDQIFSDIDPAGYMSRAGSAPGTPYGFYAQSRRGSHDNLASLNGLANGDDGSNGRGTSSPTHHGSAAPHILHSRLADLQDRGHNNLGTHTPTVRFAGHSPSGGSSPAPGMVDDHSPERTHRSTPGHGSEPGSYFPSAGPSPHGSAPLSRRTSDEQNADDVNQRDYDMSSLSRVPSYGAALRTPGTATPYTEGPPSYVEATSRPPSPGLQRPGQAHLRSGTSSPNSNSSQQTISGAFASLSMTAAPPRAAHRDSINDSGTEEARIRMLRAART
ncbi:hypothetical protein KC348_g5728 [Hortaea werneckii]|uniref:Arrestin C-terminal-like domain-containing protein n=1 Tax=Hortaea werneckii EXF-2000 TaxID=1157616 RepID=A0A1Z5T5T7_HORWE|nr:hypothetical protein KC341_g10996 [Hortaea werneckii]KAI6937520.1 hypothetical protein KC348_g5728 [Hortaea werneckii]KAI6965005.1 hypothetical protein KC321_g10339 [Hortaea werneckii]KAI7039418.1 hypothetical protein KC362_g5862 [Hortaea werneckii]OTA31379.1 hypothetical protein BTJ68_07725 [Hortaea werneckii EXF-2000]